MTAISQHNSQPSTFADVFGLVSIAGLVRCVTRTLIDARTKAGKGAPRDPSIQSLRADVRPKVGKKKPVEHLLRLNAADIEDGVPVELVNAYLYEMIEANNQRAARRERRQSAGLLSFRQRVGSLANHADVEDCEADCAVRLVLAADEPTIEQLRDARQQVLESIAPELAISSALTEKIVALEGVR